MKDILRKLVYKEKASSRSYIAWLRKKGAKIGEDVTIFVPTKTGIDETCPWLLTMGDHVRIAQGAIILTHDYSWSVLKQLPSSKGIILGAQSPVSIGDNVFIGMNAIITRGVTIGNNMIIGAGSVVTKDCQNNSVYAGNPARKIMTIEEYYQKRQSLQFEEAREMVRVFRHRFGHNPPKEVFGEYFLTMFCDSDDGIGNPVFRAQMETGSNFEDTMQYMQANTPMFDSYDAFLDACTE